MIPRNGLGGSKLSLVRGFARQHGIEVRPVDINASRWDCTLEPVAGKECLAVRLGLRMVRGLANKDGAAIVIAGAENPFESIDKFWRHAGVPVAALERLADADAFQPSLGLARRDAIWAIRALRDRPLPLFAAADTRHATLLPEISEPVVAMRPMTGGREVVEDYGAVGPTLRAHSVAFLRQDLSARRIVSCAEAVAARDRKKLTTAGLVLVRQKPASAKGVLFMTIEDETGIANIVIWKDLFERQRRVILSGSMLVVTGRVQREREVVHIVASKIEDVTSLLQSVGDRNDVFPLPHGRGDDARRGARPDPRETLGRKPRDIYSAELRCQPEITVRTRDFR